MTEQSIDSDDMSLKRLFQDFYRVPDYQREFVWGETDTRGNGGEEVEQFLNDIYSEYENATRDNAPEYFIGTIVVCMDEKNIFELIDGQQRTTTSFIILCALRDSILEIGEAVPDELKSQISANTVDWQGESMNRYRLDLQYDDANDILEQYADGKADSTLRDSTRSIHNIGNAYDTVREFIKSTLKNDIVAIKRFHGYLTNKVKIIRIKTPTVARALKIFETINDRGVGLDAMDLLKNLLFMNARPDEFSKLKDTWRMLTQEIYSAKERPLRFLRYFLLATFDVDNKLREDDLYDWFQRNAHLTKHRDEPIEFAKQLLSAAKAYKQFTLGRNEQGTEQAGLINTRLLGGQSIKQHYMILLAARHLSPENFSRLCDELEKTMFVWLITSTAGKEYERLIVEIAHRANRVTDHGFVEFLKNGLIAERERISDKFGQAMTHVGLDNTRKFRIRYILSKQAQIIDLEAYGPSPARNNLRDYMAGGFDIEHIQSLTPNKEASVEFGEGHNDTVLLASLGNLMLLEKAINRSVSNKPYSVKIVAYQSSKLLSAKCHASKANSAVGENDAITRVVEKLIEYPTWDKSEVERRRSDLAQSACSLWGVPNPAL